MFRLGIPHREKLRDFSERYKLRLIFMMALLVMVICTIESFSQLNQGQGWKKLENKVDNYVKTVMEDNQLVGLTVAVSKEGRLLLSKGYGTVSKNFMKNNKEWMTQETRTRIGSVSKVTITAPVATAIMRNQGIDPKELYLYGTKGIFANQFEKDIRINIMRFFPIVAMAISPNDRIYTWYVNRKYSVGSSKNLGKYASNLKPFYLPNIPETKISYRITDIRAIAIAPDGKVYTWFNDGRWSIGTTSDLAKHRKPKKNEKVKLPDGKKMLNIVGIAIAKSNSRVYVWYDDGTLSCGTSKDFTKYFTNKVYMAPSTIMTTDSRYIIRGIGISSKDNVYVWYGNGTVSVGTPFNLSSQKASYTYQIPDKIKALEDNQFYNPKFWWERITAYHLLNHQTGFQRDGDTKGASIMFGIPESDLTYKHIHQHFIRTRPLRWRAGHICQNRPCTAYSNHGFGLWALLVPKLTGRTYVQYATDHFLKPLGLFPKVRPMNANRDVLDAVPYNYANNTYYRQPFKNAGLGIAAGGWTASAKSLLWITRYLTNTYTTDELDKMGWGMEKRGSERQDIKLFHNGVIDGGIAFVVIFTKGYQSISKKDLSEIHIAITTNTRPINTKTEKAGRKVLKDLNELANKIARAVPDAKVPSYYNLWGGLKEVVHRAVPANMYPFLFDHGYRPVWVDAFHANGHLHFNLILQPDKGIPWVARHNLTGSQYQQEFIKWTNKGFRLQHIESYVVNNQIRYAVIFTKQSGPTWTAYHGRTLQEHQVLFNQLTAEGYRPINISVVSHNGIPRVAALYIRQNVGSFVAYSSIPVKDFQKYFDQNRKKGRQLVYLNAWRHKNRLYFSAIWHKQKASKYYTRHGLSLQKFDNQQKKQSKKGYFLQFITGYATKNGIRLASQWERFNSKPQNVIIPYSN